MRPVFANSKSNLVPYPFTAQRFTYPYTIGRDYVDGYVNVNAYVYVNAREMDAVFIAKGGLMSGWNRT